MERVDATKKMSRKTNYRWSMISSIAFFLWMILTTESGRLLGNTIETVSSGGGDCEFCHCQIFHPEVSACIGRAHAHHLCKALKINKPHMVLTYFLTPSRNPWCSIISTNRSNPHLNGQIYSPSIVSMPRALVGKKQGWRIRRQFRPH